MNASPIQPGPEAKAETPRRPAPFAAFVALYGLATATFLGVLILSAWRQGIASAFRYVGF